MWHSKSIEKICEELNTNEQGLSKKEGLERTKYGLNILPESKKKTLFKVFLEQFINPIVYILVFSAIFSLVIGEYADTILIVIVVLLDAVLGTYQEWQAEKSADNLKKILKIKTQVIREEEIIIDAENLVVGDVVMLKSGDKVPADLRIINCYNLTSDESFLTGETIAEVKSEALLDENTVVSDRTNMCFAGSTIMTGRAKCIVVEIGSNTEIGKIATNVLEAKDVKSPLVVRMEKFTRQLSIMAVLFALLLIFALYFKGYGLNEIFLLVIALVISAIPEGLPVVLTVALSIATNRMSKKNVIVKKLNSVEGLGSCTVIASDKTGTLTLNQQTLKIVVLKDGSTYDVTGIGYNGIGKVIPQNAKSQYKDSIDNLDTLAKLSVVNNEASLEYEDNKWISNGDAIDIAFLCFARKMGVIEDFNIIGIIPYESDKRYSAAFYIENDNHFVTVKGSVEKVLSFCNNSDSKEILKMNDELSKKGYRVIALAKGKTENFKKKIGYEEEDIPKLEFIGLAGFIDPIRDEAKNAIKKCIKFGIKVVMITGDYPLTATKIAKDLELIDNEDEVCTGQDIDVYLEKGTKYLDKFIKNKKVFSRVNPKQKLEIINSYKRQKEFVAVTGDGVNDAPALKGANIGIAMGSGTDVSKDAASIIITDDNFLSIVSGVEEGRYAYNNIRKVTYLLISCCLAEVVFFLLSIFFNYPMPLLAVQILWLNLVTEGIQDTALSFEKGENIPNNNHPRKTSEGLFDSLLIKETILSGVIMALILFGTWAYLISVAKFDVTLARSYIILLMVILQNIHVLNCRSEYKSVFHIPLKDNKFIVIAVLLTMALQIFASQTTILDGLLHTHTVEPIHMVYLFLLATPMILIMELFKKYRK